MSAFVNTILGTQPYPLAHALSLGLSHTAMAELNSCDTLYGLQILKYLPLDSLQKNLLAPMG